MDDVRGKTIGGFERVSPPPPEGSVRVQWVTLLEPDELTRDISNALYAVAATYDQAETEFAADQPG